MKKKRGPVRKWLTAFILSPGMIFGQAYLLMWLATNVWLNHAFKSHLQQAFISETGQRYRLEVRSLKTGLCLNSLVLKQLELSPLDSAAPRSLEAASMQIAELRIDWPELGFLPFRPSDELNSLHEVSRQILSQTAQ